MLDWLAMHPYQKAGHADYAYLQISNELLTLILNGHHKILWDIFDDDTPKTLALFLTSYFEDVISGTRIFRAFSDEHFRLYGKWVPFYEPEEYLTDEINPEDIRFLIWLFFADTDPRDIIITPHDPQLQLLADEVFWALQAHFETAPENPEIKSFLALDDKQLSYYDLRYILGWLFTDCYLFFQNQNPLLTEYHDAREYYRSMNADIDGYQIKHEVQDHFLLTHRSPLLAHRGPYWLALILGDQHPLYHDLIKLSERKTGLFEFKGTESITDQTEPTTHYLFEHVATTTLIKVNEKILSRPEDFVKPGQLYYIGFVNWKGEWWQSGIYFTLKWSADLILDMKNDIEQQALFQESSERRLEHTREQSGKFASFNNGQLIWYFRHPEEADEMIRLFTETYNKSLNLSKKSDRDIERKLLKKGIVTGKKMADDDFEGKPGFLFYNPDVGIEVLTLGDMSDFPDPDNPDFQGSFDGDDMIRFLSEPAHSPGLIHYILNKWESPQLIFPGIDQDPSLADNLDFMLRWWHPDKYFVDPKIIAI